MLQTIGIRKEYPGTLALDDISVSFAAGQVTALLGKNGAGKSTLVKILAGTVQPTAGQILVRDKPIKLPSAKDAFHQGIATVYQELSLIPGLTVAENILLGRSPRKGFMIDWPATNARAAEVLGEMGEKIDVRRRVADLGVAQQQVIEIAKAMSFRPAALMLDEPTSALAQHETEMLFRIVRQLAAKGVAIIYITHRLQELSKIADTVTVLRDGKHVGSVKYKDSSPASIVHMIFGSVVQKQRPVNLDANAPPRLEIRGLRQNGKLNNINLTVRRGEILGIAGMLGSGRTDLLRAIFGADPVNAGNLLLDGVPTNKRSPRLMKNLGVGFIPENRKEQALVLNLSIRANICLASLKKISWRRIITRQREEKVARMYVDRLAIKVSHLDRSVDSLSGGNQQKVVVGKWLNTQPRIILFDEPTRGIDLQAKQQIFQIMWDLSREGISSLFVSSELEELIEVCHRILIMKSGTIVDELRPEDTSIQQLVVRCIEEQATALP